MNSPIAAFSRSTVPTRSRIRGDDTLPLLTWTTALFTAAARAVDEIDHAVYAQVCALLLALLPGKCLQQRHRPELELEAVLLRQGAGAADVRWLADDLIVLAGEDVEGCLEPVLHKGDGQVGDVYAYPAGG